MAESDGYKMQRSKFTIIISTCDKFSDLWDANILLLNQNWPDRQSETFLVTDKPTDRKFPGVTVVAAGDNTEITERLKFVMPLIKTEYILFTLDDYFLTKRISTEAIIKDVDDMAKHSIDYMRLSALSKKNLKNRKAVEIAPKMYLMDNWAREYVVSLYAGLWKKKFMEQTLDEVMNAWQYEVALTKIARDAQARCAVSCRNEFPILDVIRKGKVLTKARAYFKQNPIYVGTRETMKRKDEIMIDLRTWMRVWLPLPLFHAAKAVMRHRGYKFFSDQM